MINLSKGYLTRCGKQVTKLEYRPYIRGKLVSHPISGYVIFSESPLIKRKYVWTKEGKVKSKDKEPFDLFPVEQLA